MSAQTIKTWFNIHKWSSLICTIFLLMLCITGLPLIFTHEIDDYFGAGTEPPAIPGATASLNKDVILEAALAEKPGKVIKYIFWDVKEHPHQMFLTLADSTEAPIEEDHYLTMDVRTAKVLDAIPNELSFMLVMYYLHVEMLAGLPGKLFLGLMGVLYILAIVSGVVLYAPIMKRFNFGMIRTEKSNRVRWLDMHNMLGIVTLAWVTVVGLTGVINTLADPAMDMWRAGQLAEMVAEYKDKPAAKGKLASIEDAVEQAKQAAPDLDVSFIAYPGTLYSSEHHYAVYMIGTTPLTSRIIQPALIDARTGEFPEGGVREQLEQIFQNIGHILREAGYDFSNVVKTTVYLTDMKDFGVLNEVYSKYYCEPFPARVAYAVAALPKGALAEADVIAVK